MSSRCIREAKQTRKKCTQYRDDGYNACSEYQDQGYNSCENWDSECCDWWPCSWACKLVTWFCVAWYWVSNWVCVAWYWVSNLVCVAWTYITETVCILWEVLTAFVAELWNGITEIFWRVVGVVDFLGGILGIRPEKKLRLNVIILKDENGNLVANEKMVMLEISRMIQIYKDQANVKVMIKGNSGEDIITKLSIEESAEILDVNCGAQAVSEDYSTQGSIFRSLSVTYNRWDALNRVTGYGCPVTVFVVRSISKASGCSLNILSNYVCVVGSETEDKTTIAHECGHSCGLWDKSSPSTNLMYETDNNDRNKLTKFQKLIMRDSKHVTYF